MPNQISTQTLSTQTPSSLLTLAIAPAKVIRGSSILQTASAEIARLGSRPLIVAGKQTLAITKESLQPILEQQKLDIAAADYGADCCEASLQSLRKAAKAHKADLIIGVGGGKALDTAKLVAHQLQLPVVTIPTSAATCAAWSALSNVYSEDGAFLYDVALSRCPDLLILDYDLIQTAPQHTLVAGIGDAIAKWYEASVSSGHSQQTLIIGAVQQARVLRDILLQKSVAALQAPGSEDWQAVVDASVLMAGVVGGLGGAQCRTVAAHAVHNGLTHIAGHSSIHGEKVAYGILVQLRLEEMVQGNQLAATSRQQLVKFYAEIGLPQKLSDLGLGNITLAELQTAAEIALNPNSDIHRLPFKVALEQLMAAMVSTTAPVDSRDATNRVSVRGISDEVEQ
ncbi:MULTISPECIES: iron-containing alcohol dehydrogenase family protein [unclassified Tolypothrix]|uniref:iron-containing alcohol dehydrogenase family protein n=1 Tax=unclassified Tolypothrix TaxID=2649714 RepID=UPI0005EAB1D6|nr:MULTISPECIES: iron-containing alcohol dehydrogenase family protein [unclassified Tolypothrix]BAY88673.1 iron-containing alcohol dehydrogenase [Microchaete diplosiphon NIES-3275]EKF01536.1 3-dehydroquinate synthase [Tolypothrix sp. PCC 7601]MBE9085346.1 iron-containing alcohol dehydrogenase family protein [Tolypothrix sp. LEGE 11397]UYD29344.1 iron-containing alcohol dehydrogenase family protein [Tolypothrix sp. PCC 7712]UYD34749.1 iron-containing alcohol dehydrogenase family protein [Tolypo